MVHRLEPSTGCSPGGTVEAVWRYYSTWRAVLARTSPIADAASVVGVDISPSMLKPTRERLENSAHNGHVVEMDAQSLAFPDNQFETVISSLSTCTFPEPVDVLREMERVCEPGGQILLLEHGRSAVGPVARFQEWRSDAHYDSRGYRGPKSRSQSWRQPVSAESIPTRPFSGC